MTARVAARIRRCVRITLIGVALAVIAWGGGFLWFIHLTSRPIPLSGSANGIVVLTGGADRIETALRLLADQRADKLLISGIGGGANLATLARNSGIDTASLVGRITLGRNATSTHGNALETADWARANGIGSLIVVTAYYHMPRALAELHSVLPEVKLLAAPVLLPDAGDHPDPGHTASARLLAEEYSKYLLTVSGVTAWIPLREFSGPAGGHQG